MSKTLTVYLAADVTKLARGLQNGQQQLSGFESAIGKIGIALASAFTVDKAVQFLQDSARAAIADEKALTSLNQTIDNMGFAGAATEVQQFIDTTQRATGVADEQLRPALDRLLRSSSSVEEAQRLLSLSLDISAGSSKDLQAVADALGKGLDGNTASLQKLGLGIDKTVIATGDMEAITAVAAKTFQGQAAAAAETYGGKIARITVAADEAKEAIGYSLLKALNTVSNAFGGTTGATGEIDKFGKRVANAIDGVDAIDRALIHLASTAGPEARGAIQLLGSSFKDVALGPGMTLLNVLGGINNLLGKGFPSDSPLTKIGGGDYSSGTDRLTYSLAALDHEALNVALDTRAAAEYQSWLDAQNKKTAVSGGVLNDVLKTQSDVIKQVQDGLKAQTSELEAATKAVTDYADNLSEKILGGLDLGEAYKAQFDDAGKKTGQTLVGAFNAQVEQAKWFGNVLTAIKAQGADQSLIEQIASLGPAAGGALGQQILDEGLLPQINASWVDVHTQIAGLAMGLVPEFLLAGQESALELVNGTVEQLQKEEKRLREIGKNIGKPIGANIKAEIAAAVAEAVTAAQAAKSAAAAERAAGIAQAGVVTTEQQVAQALQRLINTSNARTGYTGGNPFGLVFG